MENNIDLNQEISFETFKKQVLEDYRLIVTSREASLLGRREVLNNLKDHGPPALGSEKRTMRCVLQIWAFRHMDRCQW